MPDITINNTNNLKRYEFTGSSLPSDWNIVSLGSGQSVSVSSSILTISAGTTASSVTTLRCTTPFKIKCYVRFIVSLSQRIANQNFYLEITNNNGTSFARYDLNGATATTGQVQTGNGGLSNTASTITIPTTASYVSFDVYADTSDVIFSSVVSNSNSVKSGIASFDRLILDPVEDYFVQLKVVNSASAPASNTNLLVDAVIVQDLTGVKVDIVRGDGTAAIANAAPVQVLNVPAVSSSGTWTVQPGNTANTTPWLISNRSNIFYNESTTNQAASATVTGVTRDIAIAAGTTQPFSYFKAFSFSDVAGTMRIEVSNDNVTWRRATVDTAAAANTPLMLSVPALTRYHRVIYINGGTIQTSFMLNSGYVAA